VTSRKEPGPIIKLAGVGAILQVRVRHAATAVYLEHGMVERKNIRSKFRMLE